MNRLFGPAIVEPGDPRYRDLVLGKNEIFAPGTPDCVRVVGSTEQVVEAVGDAVGASKRLAVRSGGHGYENFVGDPEVRVVIDMSEMSAVYFDPGRRAFAVEAGATLGHVYQRLFKRWGLTIPGGGCPTVGAGGHFCGGGYGPLSRVHGSVVDHVYAVEVVVVDPRGTARAVIATREPADPNRDLWWAHTGGGGGNFGVVTRYWLRSAEPRGTEPADLLPRAPASVVQASAVWPWAALTRASFVRLVKNHGAWHERNSTPDSPEAALFSMLLLFPRKDGPESAGDAGSIVLQIVVDAATPNAASLVNDYVAAVNEGVGVEVRQGSSTTPWLRAILGGSSAEGDGTRSKHKAAYLRKCYGDPQIAAIHDYLVGPYPGQGALLGLVGYGGKVSSVEPEATAIAQRDSILKAVFVNSWNEGEDDEARRAWVRSFYQRVYRDTGGVPVPNAINDGSSINCPDGDLLDPRFNQSGVPWYTLYYKDHYPRLQAIKRRWDPRNVFRHAMSIRV
ncbi:FAD-binding oxidoreductase [Pendulispora albinea]|uniref:FAD-binding protein n=1 Tax=Pendulispora albinea TaxID=2741071 RepID=A0ABZ2LK87_9BACT